MRAGLAIGVLASCASCGGGGGGDGPGTGTATTAGTGSAATISNHKPPAQPLPVECTLEPAESGGAPWERRNKGDCLGVARTVDEGWIVLMFDRLLAYDRDGHPRWVAPFDHKGPDGRGCGYPAGLAVDAAGRTAVACGYSLLGFAADGTFRWQVWPGGDHHTTTPLVDADGTIYLGVDGTLYAVAADGTTKWHVGTGWNRYFSALAPTDSGALMFETVMAARHSEDTGHGHFYYEYEPPELFVVDRAGHILRREPRKDGDTAAYPAWVDVVGEGGGRLP